MVTSMNQKHMTCLSATGKKDIIEKEALAKEWSGIVLVAEVKEKSGEKNYLQQRRKEWLHNARLPFIAFGLLVLAGLATLSNFQLWDGSLILIPALMLLKLCGCVISYFLLLYELDKSNPLLQQMCSFGKRTNCNAVLGSPAARLFNFASWSEIGFIYFTGELNFI